ANGSSAAGPGNHNAGNGGNIALDATGVLAVGNITSSGGDGVGSGNGGNGGTIDLTGGGGITLNNNISSLHGVGSPIGADGDQTYHSAVILGGDAILSGGTIAFNSTINGAHNLTVNSADGATPTTTLGDVVGGLAPLTSFTINSLSPLLINQNITAGSVTIRSGIDGSGNLDFGPAVQIQANNQSYRAGSGSGNTAVVHLNA